MLEIFDLLPSGQVTVLWTVSRRVYRDCTSHATSNEDKRKDSYIFCSNYIRCNKEGLKGRGHSSEYLSIYSLVKLHVTKVNRAWNMFWGFSYLSENGSTFESTVVCVQGTWPSRGVLVDSHASPALHQLDSTLIGSRNSAQISLLGRCEKRTPVPQHLAIYKLSVYFIHVVHG